jgi:glycosyltransferase involved in cell wall biosynthesis
MKKVCILSSVHQAFDTRIFHKEAKSLAKAGYDVTLIAQHDRDEVVDGIKIIALPRPKNRLRRMLGTTWKAFNRARKQKADVYHFHDPELLLVGLLLKLATKGKVIYDVHEDYPKAILTKYWLPSLVRKPVARIFGSLEKWAASRFDHTITASAVYDGVLKRLEGMGKITAIKNHPIVESIEPDAGRHAEPNTIIYAGGLAQIRGISEIVRAMGYLDSSREARLVLYGKFNPEDYQETVRGLKGFDRVDYRGWMEPEQLWPKLSEATVGIACLHPVERYLVGLPTKLFEYMAAGLPVIASNFPAWKEIVEGNSCGLTVNPLDPEDIARAIEYLIEHPEEARKMGQNGKKAVKEKYNWETESRKLIELYESLLKGEQIKR